MRVLASLLILALGVNLAPADEKQPEKADIRGLITRVSAANKEAQQKGILGSILVEGNKELTTQYDKASVRVTDKTKITMRFGPEKKVWGFEDLKKGRKVQVIFTGPVAESYPVQAVAKEIVVLEEAK